LITGGAIPAVRRCTLRTPASLTPALDAIDDGSVI
jgi:hypothetical protein